MPEFIDAFFLSVLVIPNVYVYHVHVCLYLSYLSQANGRIELLNCPSIGLLVSFNAHHYLRLFKTKCV